MKKKKLRLLSCILTIFIVFSFVDCLNVLNVKAAEDNSNGTTGKLGDLEYTISNGEATITKCNNTDGTVEIPSKIDGNIVTKIADEAFLQCTFIDEVIVPGTVKEIGKNAFKNCYMLKKSN